MPPYTGARVGLANEVRERLRVQWTDASNPSAGFQYLYLTSEDYSALALMAEQRGCALPLRAEPRVVPKAIPAAEVAVEAEAEAAMVAEAAMGEAPTSTVAEPDVLAVESVDGRSFSISNTSSASGAGSGAGLSDGDALASGRMEMQWVLSDVIGLEDGIGVECLSGSGAIASAYCRAFRCVCNNMSMGLADHNIEGVHSSTGHRAGESEGRLACFER